MWALLWLVVGVTSDVSMIDNTVNISTIAPNVTFSVLESMTQGNKVAEQPDQTYVIQTDHGAVRGYKDDSGIVQYFDIPYGHFNAETPFEEPSVPESWEHIHEKTEHTSLCPQINSDNNYIGNHECLTLSVFKPENAENADVLFHIHDSSFTVGSGDPAKYGPKYLVPQGIILIMPNYRLGPLGFLCMQNETAPGNAGLKDLTLALLWTKNNIEAFGGNSSKIVVSGSGAAGALAEYLVLANDSRPFISKAIIESGFVLSPWAIDRYPTETAKAFHNKLNSNKDSDENQNLNLVYFDNIEALVRAGQGINFRPCIKNESGFLTESPWFLLNNEKLDVTIMSGSSNQAAMLRALDQTEQSLSQINEDYLLLLPNDLKFDNNNDKIVTAELVKEHYFGDKDITINEIEKLSQCYSDSNFLYPGIRGTRLLAECGATVYFYEFSYGNNHPLPGAAEGDMLSLVFSTVTETSASDSEHEMKDIVRELWVSFIKTGTPSSGDIQWDHLKANAGSDEAWLSIGDEVIVQIGYHENRLNLWNDIYEKYFVEHNVALKLNCSISVLLLSVLIVY